MFPRNAFFGTSRCFNLPQLITHQLASLAMVSTFPSEIMLEFMFYINEDHERLKTLLYCCLISETWYVIAQPYLYSQVTLSIDDTPPNSLINTLSNFHRDHVHHLLLKISQAMAISASSFLPAPGDFPSLRSLQIHPPGFGMILIRSQEFIANLRPVLSSRLLTSLDLSQLAGVPTEILYQCHALQRLSSKKSDSQYLS